MGHRRLRNLVLAGATSALIAFSAHAQQGSPRWVVEQLNDVIENVMKESSSLGFEGRYQWLDPVIRDSFNLPFMAEVAAGRYWGRGTEEQKRLFVEAFSKMTTAIYAVRFDTYAGDTFVIQGEEMVGQSSVLVRCQIVRSDGNRIPVHYLLRSFDGPWRIVDVYAWGKISELTGRKETYEPILKDEGMDVLAKSLETEVAKMRRTEALREELSSVPGPGARPLP
ncbi:MAG: ABC transporter substrate-binding protein [Alphaproteobacteria bacterium]